MARSAGLVASRAALCKTFCKSARVAQRSVAQGFRPHGLMRGRAACIEGQKVGGGVGLDASAPGVAARGPPSSWGGADPRKLGNCRGRELRSIGYPRVAIQPIPDIKWVH